MSKVHDPLLGAYEPQKISTVKPAMVEAQIPFSETSEDDPAAEPRAESREPAGSDPASDSDS